MKDAARPSARSAEDSELLGVMLGIFGTVIMVNVPFRIPDTCNFGVTLSRHRLT